jgi:SanA protein
LRLLTQRLNDFELREVEVAEYELSGTKKNLAQRRLPWVVVLLAIFLIAIAIFPWGWRKWVQWRYNPVTYSAADYLASAATPRVAIVFGARVYGEDRLSAMLRDRMDTAIALYFAGKVDKLLLSGGQNGDDYDEPAAMVAHARARGVPAEAIQADYGGRRTYDSCYRAANIFQVKEAVLVTQVFHLPRALLLCDNLGINVVGVKADRRIYDPRSIAFSESREIPALLFAIIDLVRRPLPSILGQPIPLQ